MCLKLLHNGAFVFAAELSIPLQRPSNDSSSWTLFQAQDTCPCDLLSRSIHPAKGTQSSDLHLPICLYTSLYSSSPLPQPQVSTPHLPAPSRHPFPLVSQIHIPSSRLLSRCLQPHAPPSPPSPPPSPSLILSMPPAPPDKPSPTPFLSRLRPHLTRTARISRRALHVVSTSAHRSLTSIQSRASAALNDPNLSKRFSPEYVRGGIEILTATVVLSTISYATYRGLVRFPTATHIPPRLIRRNRTIHGIVASVRDGDGVRIRHVPWLRRVLNDYRVPRVRRMADHTISVRLAGVDAPESAQRFGKAARDWLKGYTLGQRVEVKMHAMDRYSRIVGTVYRKSGNRMLRVMGIGRKNVSLELSRAGYATLYRGADAQYGGERLRRMYVKVEEMARKRKIGMWADRNYVSPMDFKKAMRKGDLAKVLAKAGKKADKSVVVKETVQTTENKEPTDSLLQAIYKFAAFSYEFLKRYR